MGTLQEVSEARRWTRYGIVIAYVMGIGGFAFRLAGTSPRVPQNVWGIAGAAAVMGIFFIAPTVAVLALRGRPRLLPAAAAVAFVAGLFTLSLLGFIMLIPALLWIKAFSRWPRPVQTRWREIVLWPAVVTAAACAFFVLFAHQDPRCTRTFPDGTVETSVAAGAGWVWQGASGSAISSSYSGDSVLSEECTSDIVTWWEALASLGVAAGSVAIAARGGAPSKTPSELYAIPNGHR